GRAGLARRARARCRFLPGALRRRAAGRGGCPGLDVLPGASVRLPHALSTLAFCDLRNGASGHNGERLLFENVRVAGTARRIVLRFDEKPVGLAVARAAAQAHQVPGAVKLLAVEGERELAFVEPPVRVILRLPRAAIPDHHGAAAVLALGDRAFERVVLGRVVLHLHGEPLLARNEARAARDGPALHHAVELEPQVVMQPARGVLLDDELMPGAGGLL